LFKHPRPLPDRQPVDLIGMARAITRLDVLETEIEAFQKTEASKTRS
jgi:hypothetical protein